MEHIALYRQFRPMDFDEMVEQDAAVTTLRQAVITKKIGHAYIFCGQRGTGKTSIARVFARAINCESPVNGNPCNKCPTCRGILDGSLMDVIEIDAASNTSVENIKKICEEVNYAPTRAPYKVYIIDEVHMLSKGASNALLKTLEEPPKHAVFLFATTEIHKILPTIISRCQRYDFRRISSDAIVKRLEHICSEEKIQADKEALMLIASLSDGALRDALSLLDQASSCANGKMITARTVEDMTGTVNDDFMSDMASALIKSEYDRILTLCAKLSESGKDTVQFTLELARYFRDLLVIRVIPHPGELVKGSAGTIRRMYDTASLTNTDTLVAFITFLSKLVSELKWSPSPKTSFEISMLRLAGRKVKAEVKPLVMPEEYKTGSDGASKKTALPNIAVSAGNTKDEPSEKKEEKKEEKPAVKSPSPFSSPIGSSSSSAPAPEEAKAPSVSSPLDLKSKLDILRSAPVPKTDPAPSKEDPKKEDKPSDLPPIARPAAKEEKPEGADKPFSVPSSGFLDSLKKLTEEKKEPVKESTPEPLPLPVLPPEPEEQPDPEDIPMDNQIDIFSIGSSDSKPKEVPAKAPAKVSEEKPASKEEEPDVSDSKVFSGISDSVLDETFDQHAPTGRIGETRKSSLAVAVEETPIATKKRSGDPYEVWDEIMTSTEREDPLLAQTLSQCGFKFEIDSVYMVFPNEMSETVKALRSNSRYKLISNELKERVAGAEHVYLCTDMQYANAMALSGRKPEAEEKKVITPEEKLQQLFDKGASMGIETEIHFGDD
ncbi:MAG: DNA polymerase III subunit gamma/tau [Clostridiales bacterium]|nr:DNA polymerase III subunit gamma/tau [Clostridiales bacterium]